ncbi:MAG TPA: DNA repair protein RecO [Cyclobacteriaceae bacterium]|nr:DNA repair protein RecO [Cyclobacteriaceae bacterium]
MLHKTRGIVFRFTKYGDSSIIVTIFTELFGLQTYIVNGVRSKSAKGKIALFQPLTLLDMVVYYKENANIKRIKEVRCFHQFQTLQTDIKKSSIALFINEVLNKTVKEEAHASEQFEFLQNSLITLDQQEKGFENFHLIFLVKLSRFLGFGAHQVNDISQGIFTQPEEEEVIGKLINAEYGTSVALTQLQRRSMLEIILRFYTSHIDSLGEIRSVHVLKEIMG